MVPTLLGLLGLVSFVIGLALVWTPLAFLAVGAGLVRLSLLLSPLPERDS